MVKIKNTSPTFMRGKHHKTTYAELHEKRRGKLKGSTPTMRLRRK